MLEVDHIDLTLLVIQEVVYKRYLTVYNRTVQYPANHNVRPLTIKLDLHSHRLHAHLFTAPADEDRDSVAYRRACVLQRSTRGIYLYSARNIEKDTVLANSLPTLL